jgi:hypothetical protein
MVFSQNSLKINTACTIAIADLVNRPELTLYLSGNHPYFRKHIAINERYSI